MLDLKLLIPVFRYANDFSKVLIEDDKYDLAFPTRSNGEHRLHHFHTGLLVNIGTSIALNVIPAISEIQDVFRIVQKEEYRPGETPSQFMKRCIRIHRKTYDRRQEQYDLRNEIDYEAEERLKLLTEYINSLTKRAKQNSDNNFARKKVPKDVIYMGKLKLKSDSEPPIKPPAPPGIRNAIRPVNK